MINKIFDDILDNTIESLLLTIVTCLLGIVVIGLIGIFAIIGLTISF